MDSYVFQCDVPRQWIAQRQVGPVSIYCDGVGCHALCLRHGIPVWQDFLSKYHCYKWAVSRCDSPKMFKSDVKTKQHNTSPSCEITPIAPKSDLSIGLSSGVKFIHVCIGKILPKCLYSMTWRTCFLKYLV